MLIRHALTAILATSTPLAAPFASAHGDYHSVVAKLGEELAVDPGNTSLRLLMATAHVEHGEWDLCLDELATIHRLSPGTHRLGHLAGKALLGKGDLVDALAKLEGFLAEEPNHQDALASRARVLMRMERFEEAVRDYLAALSSPAGADLHVEAVEVLRRLNRLEEAHRLAEAAVEATEGDATTLICAAEVAVEAGRIDSAAAHLESLRKTWPRPEPWMMEKARLLDEAGRTDESRAAWRELHDHLMALPSLERAQPFLAAPLAAARRALGIVEPAAVVAPPAAR